ncbi:MAG: hypothetical protein ACE5GQ_06775, partial [Nitrospinales bacterium]
AVLAPERIVSFLEVISKETSQTLGPGHKAHEIVLLRRKHPSIDLALAKYGVDERVLRRVFKRGNAGVRCAALRNKFAIPRGGLFKGWLSMDHFNQIIRNGTKAELSALMQNEFVEGKILQMLFKREDVFSEIEESRWQLIIYYISSNPRLNKDYQGPFLDGWAFYKWSAFENDAWKLSTVVPVTLRWADALEPLYRKIRPIKCEDHLISSALERWKDDPSLEGPKYNDYLPLRARIADCLDPNEELANSDDLALRLSFYRRFFPYDFLDWSPFLERDGEEFIEAILQNEGIWRDKSLRTQLCEMAWAYSDPDSSSLFFTNLLPDRYLAVEEQMKKEHPEWFRSEIDEYSEETESVVRRMEKKVVALEKKLEQISSHLIEQEQTVSMSIDVFKYFVFMVLGIMFLGWVISRL